MILEDFIVLTKTGLFCKYGNFYIDPTQPAKVAVISHAHGDHAVGGHQEVYCTTPTALFMQQRYKKFAAGNFTTKNYEQPFTIGEVTLKFISAGHMLGSAQILLIYKNVSYLYTGDYKLAPDDSCDPISFTQADVLITETTFADPETVHPDAACEIQKLNGTAMNIMLGAYALGKSQRLIALINKYCPTKKILLHHSIVPFTKIYESMGRVLGNYMVYDRKTMKLHPEDHIYIVPPMVFNSYFRAVNVKKVFVTGWKHLQKHNDIQLYISDHTDWEGILEMIGQTEPQEVWTLHGNGLKLQQHLEGSIKVKILN